MGSNLIKQEFCNAVKLQYGWPVDDIPSTYPRVYADKAVRSTTPWFVNEADLSYNDIEHGTLTEWVTSIRIKYDCTGK